MQIRIIRKSIPFIFLIIRKINIRDHAFRIPIISREYPDTHYVAEKFFITHFFKRPILYFKSLLYNFHGDLIWKVHKRCNFAVPLFVA